MSDTAPPPIPERAGLLTRAAKGKARAQVMEAQPVTVINPPTRPSSAPYGLRNRKGRAPIVDTSPDEVSDLGDNNTLRKVTEMPPGVSIPRVQVEAVSPPKTKLPCATGMVPFYFPYYFL